MARTVLITGTSSGIGKAATLAFAAAGWNVAATMRRLDEQDYSKLPHVKTYVLDVTDTASIQKAFAAATKDFSKIDVVVNNAGYAVDGVFEAMSDDVIEKQFNTNLFGLMRMTRQAVSSMRPNGGGTIIQIASMGGRVTFPLYSIYHASKWAVEGFSESLQFELRQFNIKMKIVEPGAIKTPFYSSSRTFIKPDSKLGYEKFVKHVEATSINAGRAGKPPEVVARVIVKAAEDSSYRLRYIVGSPAPLILFMRKLLPERLFLFLIRKQYRI